MSVDQPRIHADTYHYAANSVMLMTCMWPQFCINFLCSTCSDASSLSMEEMLLHTDDFRAAIAEIESVGGRVTLLLGDDLLVAKVPSEFIAKRRNFESASAHISESASPKTLTYVQAYWMAREKEMKPQSQPKLWTDMTAPIVLP